MFQLYKKRGFSEFVSDTFDFLKQEGKCYFKNYFIINGGLLLLLVVSLYFLMKVYFESIFASIGNTNNNPNALVTNLMNNMGVFIGLGIFSFVIIILVSLINYSFPVSYLKLMETNTEITTATILNTMKEKVGRTILFFLASLITIVPIFIIIGVIVILLCFIIIGIPLMFVVFPALISWSILSYFDYMSTENGFIQSLGNGFDTLKKRFWPIVGSTVIMYIIVQIIVGITSMIPYSIAMANVYTGIETGNTQDSFSTITIVMTIIIAVSVLFNYTLQNLIFINQGIIYYSVKEENENISIKSDIDLIGSDSE